MPVRASGSRRYAVAVAAALAVSAVVPLPAAAEPAPGALGFDLDAATIPQLQERMDRRGLSSVRLTAEYLSRVRRIDPKLHSVLALNPGALAEAGASDVRRLTGRSRGALDGIPVLLKDNVDTRGLPTTAGSRALTGSPPADAELVRRLRSAGAVVLGKTNLSEWANFRSISATSGWSGAGGQTNNPHVLDRNPCGSSSGSAVAVAASLAQVAIGTETNGSIVCPAGANGVVGMKPSLGLVSRTGVVPISAEQDTAGPLSRHVVDSAITLSALQGRDVADPATGTYPPDQPADYAAGLDTGSLRGARIGVWRQAGTNAAVDAVVERSVWTMRAAGATVVDVELPYLDEIAANSLPALLTEFRRDLTGYLEGRPGAPKSLEELIAFNRADPVELSRFGQELFEQAAAAPGPDDAEYQRRRATATSMAERSIDEVLAGSDLDAIVSPANGPAWKTSYPEGDAFEVGSSEPAAVAGYPSVAVPAGFDGKLPIGLSFFGTRWADARILSLAAGFEDAADARQAPAYLASI